ncbi:MAG: LacI family DNA-binding transcriptional regulator [Pseudotabrizicola sp.]|uniref:LacI family DNA-binding transcriptional regulator n=1 Tax=Pseudotabrizicola sp. TaxID=2939647 RepID=UPI0027230785|nr:LacI family DNA-binding transcriptional regulator [Pseudotabrizicola sp.]MDO8882842.1 LacI family DNA-binding transcriptional regulator [Pseudotabrizicola sp.]MDP2080585.1 LacI family DNA-binding transcriptional regulator [Pseudotabrizicola sp.]MDZ7573313.1 LacI family DNA-binding transcriptional regulator [Pseudotabrizicola sp.]
MGRPTVTDIAREAGVSLATVDRVLNARPGVRDKTIAAVNDAIARLGYVRDMAAANLARGRNSRVAILLPDTQSQFVDTLHDAIGQEATLASAARMQVELVRYPGANMHVLAAILSDLVAGGISGVALMAPETPVVRDALRSVNAAGVPVVAMVSDLPNSGAAHYVGIDGYAAGRTAGLLMGRFLGAQTPRVMVIAQSMLLRDSIERRRGFDAVMLRDFPGIEVGQTLESHGAPEILQQVMREALSSSGPIGGIYLLGSGHRALAQVLSEMGLLGRVVTIGHELTPHTIAALQAGWLDAVIAQNVGHLARSTLRVLQAKVDQQPINESQERLRLEIILRENLPLTP